MTVRGPPCGGCVPRNLASTICSRGHGSNPARDPMQNLLVQSFREHMSAPGLEIVIAVTAALCRWDRRRGAREAREARRAADARARLPAATASFTMASYAFTERGDASRVAAQIVSGIGFLGAGAILHGSGFISGMTTAATIWVTAAVGMIAATGHVAAALGLAIFVRLLHTGIYYWENRHILSVPASVCALHHRPGAREDPHSRGEILEDYQVRQATFEKAETAGGHLKGTVTFVLPQRHRRDFLCALAAIPEVLEIVAEPAGRAAV